MGFGLFARYKIPVIQGPFQAFPARDGKALSASTAIWPRLMASYGLNVPSWKPLMKPLAAILHMAPYDHSREGSASLKGARPMAPWYTGSSPNSRSSSTAICSRVTGASGSNLPPPDTDEYAGLCCGLDLFLRPVPCSVGEHGSIQDRTVSGIIADCGAGRCRTDGN